MSLTPSTMVALGTPAPDFALPDTRGALVRRGDFAEAPALLVVFLCNHCPYVVHLRTELADFADEVMARGVAVVGINSNDAERYPADAPAAMRVEAARHRYAFPYLFDESQEVARAYGAACTPDFFLYDGARRLAYRGQFDDSRPGNGLPITGADLRRAVDDVLAGRRPLSDQQASMGCNIKWKPDNEPGWF
jgi:peroxiredoxin